MTTDRYERQILSLIISLVQTAMWQMGKVPNPITGKCERDLAATQGTIELLLAIQARTKNNLTPKEEKFMADSLTSLQLTFVQEKNRPAAAESAPAAAESSPTIIEP